MTFALAWYWVTSILDCDFGFTLCRDSSLLWPLLGLPWLLPQPHGLWLQDPPHSGLVWLFWLQSSLQLRLCLQTLLGAQLEVLSGLCPPVFVTVSCLGSYSASSIILGSCFTSSLLLGCNFCPGGYCTSGPCSGCFFQSSLVWYWALLCHCVTRLWHSVQDFRSDSTSACSFSPIPVVDHDLSSSHHLGPPSFRSSLTLGCYFSNKLTVQLWLGLVATSVTNFSPICGFISGFDFCPGPIVGAVAPAAIPSRAVTLALVPSLALACAWLTTSVLTPSWAMTSLSLTQASDSAQVYLGYEFTPRSCSGCYFSSGNLSGYDFGLNLPRAFIWAMPSVSPWATRTLAAFWAATMALAPLWLPPHLRL